jgi:hypothetical protein
MYGFFTDPPSLGAKVKSTIISPPDGKVVPFAPVGVGAESPAVVGDAPPVVEEAKADSSLLLPQARAGMANAAPKTAVPASIDRREIFS